jgi:hypothetical protein
VRQCRPEDGERVHSTGIVEYPVEPAWPWATTAPKRLDEFLRSTTDVRPCCKGADST